MTTSYPPTTTWTFEGALDEMRGRLADVEDRIGDLEPQVGGDDPDPEAQRNLAEARQEQNALSNQRDGLEWAIEEFGPEAEVVFEATTRKGRDSVKSTIRQTIVGDIGSDQLSRWLTADAIQAAPWLEGGEDLPTQAEILGDAIPPALTDWCDERRDELNDLTEGN